MKKIMFFLILMLLVGMFLTGCQVQKSGLTTGPTSTPTSVVPKSTTEPTGEPITKPTTPPPELPSPPKDKCLDDSDCNIDEDDLIRPVEEWTHKCCIVTDTDSPKFCQLKYYCCKDSECGTGKHCCTIDGDKELKCRECCEDKHCPSFAPKCSIEKGGKCFKCLDKDDCESGEECCEGYCRGLDKGGCCMDKDCVVSDWKCINGKCENDKWCAYDYHCPAGEKCCVDLTIPEDFDEGGECIDEDKLCVNSEEEPCKDGIPCLGLPGGDACFKKREAPKIEASECCRDSDCVRGVCCRGYCVDSSSRILGKGCCTAGTGYKSIEDPIHCGPTDDLPPKKRMCTKDGCQVVLSPSPVNSPSNTPSNAPFVT